MVFNVFCVEKRDETWIGLIECDAFHPSHIWRRKRRALLYYGGRGRNRPSDGRKCHQHCRGSDCYVGGSIHGGQKIGQVIQHPIPMIVAGDWLSFHIDFDAKTVQFYHGEQLQYTTKPEEFPAGKCYFAVTLDRPQDVFYVEQGVIRE